MNESAPRTSSNSGRYTARDSLKALQAVSGLPISSGSTGGCSACSASGLYSRYPVARSSQKFPPKNNPGGKNAGRIGIVSIDAIAVPPAVQDRHASRQVGVVPANQAFCQPTDDYPTNVIRRMAFFKGAPNMDCFMDASPTGDHRGHRAQRRCTSKLISILI